MLSRVPCLRRLRRKQESRLCLTMGKPVAAENRRNRWGIVDEGLEKEVHTSHRIFTCASSMELVHQNSAKLFEELLETGFYIQHDALCWASASENNGRQLRLMSFEPSSVYMKPYKNPTLPQRIEAVAIRFSYFWMSEHGILKQNGFCTVMFARTCAVPLVQPMQSFAARHLFLLFVPWMLRYGTTITDIF